MKASERGRNGKGLFFFNFCCVIWIYLASVPICVTSKNTHFCVGSTASQSNSRNIFRGWHTDVTQENCRCDGLFTVSGTWWGWVSDYWWCENLSTASLRDSLPCSVCLNSESVSPAAVIYIVSHFWYSLVVKTLEFLPTFYFHEEFYGSIKNEWPFFKFYHSGYKCNKPESVPSLNPWM